MLFRSIRQAGPPREVFERPLSPFIARFIGNHNVITVPDGKIAVRADKCRIGTPNGGPFVSGRVTAVEYQGSMVRVALMTDPGDEASALVPDGAFYAAPVEPGQTTTVSWSPQDAHKLQEAA